MTRRTAKGARELDVDMHTRSIALILRRSAIDFSFISHLDCGVTYDAWWKLAEMVQELERKAHNAAVEECAVVNEKWGSTPHRMRLRKRD